MTRPATAQLKCNPPLGRMPVLQFIPPAELQIDAAYQRSIDAGDSQTLIRQIAQHWNWDLCQPLVVSRRIGEGEAGLFVIDGQHRLAASRLRGDIAQLPCVIIDLSTRADEAASFVHLNQQRRPLKALDLFKAALASGDKESLAIEEALTAAGLSLAPHTNIKRWKPGMLANIRGIQRAWREHGSDLTQAALRILARGFEGQVLRYAGTIFPGLVVALKHPRKGLGETELIALLAEHEQEEWRRRIANQRIQDPNLSANVAAAAALFEAHQPPFQPSPARQTPAPPRLHTSPALAAPQSKSWCEQCEQLRTPEQARLCHSAFCKAKAVAA